MNPYVFALKHFKVRYWRRYMRMATFAIAALFLNALPALAHHPYLFNSVSLKPRLIEHFPLALAFVRGNNFISTMDFFV